MPIAAVTKLEAVSTPRPLPPRLLPLRLLPLRFPPLRLPPPRLLPPEATEEDIEEVAAATAEAAEDPGDEPEALADKVSLCAA